MSRHIYIPIVLIALYIIAMPVYGGNDTKTPQGKKLFSGHPLAGAFYENRGQIVDTDGNTRPEIKYYAYCGGVQLYFTQHGWHTVYSVAEPGEDAICEATGDGSVSRSKRVSRVNHERWDGQRFRLYRMDLTFVGCNKDAEIEALAPMERHLNYYLAHCPDGITQIPAHGVLRYRNIYDNVDMILYASTEGLKYEFEVRPGGRVADIHLRHEGTDGIEEQADGSLHIRWPQGYTREGRPYSYQMGGGELREIRSAWQRSGGDLLIAVDRYDASTTLVLDPWSTFIGGYNTDVINALACDQTDAVYATGWTESYDFPVYRAWQPSGNARKNNSDGYVVRFDRDGGLSWSTYYGGSDIDGFRGIAIDPAGNVLVGGSSISFDFPVHNAFQSRLDGYMDAVFVKLDSAGKRIWSTYFGGGGGEENKVIGCDAAGNVYAAGNILRDSNQTHMPLMRAFQSTTNDRLNWYFLKVDSSAALIFSSYLGGSYSSSLAGEELKSMAVYPTGEFVLGGATGAYDFPVLRARQPVRTDPFINNTSDGVVVMIDSSGVPRWSTYHGAYDSDVVFGVALDRDGTIVVTGQTTSRDFPVMNPIQGRYGGGNCDGFVSKFDTSGALLYSTYYGGLGTEELRAVCVDTAGNSYIAGRASSGFPTHNAQYPSEIGGGDGVVMKFDSANQRQWATYLGGSESEYINAIACDKRGYVYVGGQTRSSDFPVFNAFQDSLGRLPYQTPPYEDDGFITRIRHDGYIPVTLSRLSAQRVYNGVRLDWRSESEVNAYGFIIERRYEHVAAPANAGWRDVGFVPAKVQGNEGRDYDYLDLDPGSHDVRIFYRLRMVDLDGSFEHSPVVEVAPESGALAVGFETAHPSPARDWLTLNFTLPKESTVSLSIHDIAGRDITRVYDQHRIAAGKHSVMLSVGDWLSGLYLCTLTVDGRSLVRRAMVVR